MMPAIIRSFQVKLTRQQSKQFRTEWASHGEPEGSMLIGQPKVQWGPFEIKYGHLTCAILDKKLSDAISKTISKHSKARPA